MCVCVCIYIGPCSSSLPSYSSPLLSKSVFTSCRLVVHQTKNGSRSDNESSNTSKHAAVLFNEATTSHLYLSVTSSLSSSSPLADSVSRSTSSASRSDEFHR
jgi:hypothetical protein